MSSENEIQAAGLLPDSQRRDPRDLTTLQDILSCLSSYESEEAELSNTLSGLLGARDSIVESLTRLQSLVPQLDELRGESAELSARVSRTAQTADRVGSRVRSLDEEMGRVREAGERVGQVVELKSSLSALAAAIESQDWETAVRHCAKAMSLPRAVISGPFAETAVPTAENHLPPAQTLQSAREHLLTVFRQNFVQSSRSRDSTATTRFFKLFPAIGWEEEGLQAYAEFVIDLVRVRPPPSAKMSSPLYFVTAMTALFESIAVIVDQHQPVVEKYYGGGKMKVVLERLLQECDRVVKSLLESWKEERSIQRRLSEIANLQAPAHNPNRRPQATPEEITVDPREVDKTLSEISGMVGRWFLFQKFLFDVFQGGAPEQSLSGDEVLNMLEQSQSTNLFEDLITSYYMPMEIWYTRTTIDKAHRLSTSDNTQYPLASTTPDDVFYILKAVFSRLISMGSHNAMSAMVAQLREIMERDFARVIKKKLDDVYRNSNPNQGLRGDKADRENRATFIMLLNDLDTSSSHVDRLMRDISGSPLLEQQFIELHHEEAKTRLLGFITISTKFQSMLRVGIEQLFNQLIRPRLRTFISDVYRDVSYALDDPADAAAEYQDNVRKRFIQGWEGLVEGYKDMCTENNYQLLFGLILDVIIRPWEKLVLSMKFNQRGVMRFERDVTAIRSYLTSQTTFGDAREKFARLQQIITVLDLDAEDDVDEFYNGSGIPWRLTANEAKAIVALKV
ncbi:COG4-domain-containing protein [Pluteus cervinus]|uniref:COG4-domain-containing protein n=1 Tax=Pluteus cervinus TaxID=181527 RepID=A0ACD3B4L9_9AGAR|nr:COG4-domain-containing protein [Pluteus cervinus]